MPRVSLVGSGHGSPDYATLALWEAAEFGVDYGSRIEAQCLGDCGAGANLSGTAVNGALVTTFNVTYDGTNETALAEARRTILSITSDIEVNDFIFASDNAFVAACNVQTDTLTSSRCIFENRTTGQQAITISGNYPNTLIQNFVARGGADTIDVGFGRGTVFRNGLIFNALDKGVESSSSPQLVLENVFSFLSGGDNYDSAGTMTLTRAASQDTTGTAGLTGFTSAELVDFANNDLRTKASSTLATAGTNGTFIGAFLESGGPPSAIDSSGAFESGTTTITGVSDLAFSSSGVFTSAETEITGISSLLSNSQGTFTSGDTVVDGTSVVVVGSQGEFLSSDTEIEGVSNLVVDTTGTFTSGQTLIDGTSDLVVTSQGVFTSSDTVVVGSSELVIGTSGIFTSSDTTIVGNSNLLITSSGEFLSQDTVITGVDVPLTSSTGSFISDDTTITGISDLLVNTLGSFVSDTTVIAGDSDLLITSSGVFTSSDTVISGNSDLLISSSGSFISDETVITGVDEAVVSSSGTFISDPTAIVGISNVLVDSSGGFLSGDTTITGTDALPVEPSFEGVLSVEIITRTRTAVSVTPKYSVTKS